MTDEIICPLWVEVPCLVLNVIEIMIKALFPDKGVDQ